MQNRDLSAIEGQKIASAVVKVLKMINVTSILNCFGMKIKDKDIDEPILPRK